MSAKRARKSKNFHNNVVQINNYLPEKSKTVKIVPRNRAQESYMLTLADAKRDVVFGIGPAGTGKTLIAVLTAIKFFKEGVVDRIVVTRPAVSVDEDLGFLPGTLEQKMAPWTRPIFDVLREYFTAKEIEGMIAEGVIEIAPLAFMRGRTFKNAYIIADEMQNSTANQMKMLLTRLGEGSKMAVTGDLNQADRMKDNGLIDFVNQLNRHGNATHLATVTFDHQDIERHDAVKEVLEVYGDE
jgi:phosphate starvation-inducible PhoH-like protein|tara:strand:- start:563 stop:1285 length:723 start_codon:yes stop_codon:yes gene_type:complete